MDPGGVARLRGVPVEQTPSYQEILEEERRLPEPSLNPFPGRSRQSAARQPEATATVQTEGPCFERVPRAQVEAALEAARSQLADAAQVLRVAERGRQQAGSAPVIGRLGYLADLARLVSSEAESRVHALEQVLAGQLWWMSGCDEYVARRVSGGAKLETRVRVVSALLGAELLVASKSGLNLLALWGLLPTNAVGLITGMLHVLKVGDLHDRLLRLLQEAKEQLFGSDPERFEAHVAEEVGGLQKAGSAWDTAALLVGLASIGVAGYASSSRMGRAGPLQGPRVRAKPSGGGGARGQQPRPAPKVPAAPEGSPASGAPKRRTAKPDGAGHPPPAAPRGGSSAPRPAAPAGHGPSVQGGPSAPAKLPPPKTPAAPPGSVGSPSVGTPPSPPAQLPAGAPTQAGVRPAVPGVPAAPPPAPPRSPAGAAPPPPKPPAAAAPAAPPPAARAKPEPKMPGHVEGGKRTGGPYSHLEDHPSVGPAKDFTQTQKRRILAENEARNGGVIRDDKTGEMLVRPQKHQKGVRPPDNEAHVDHVIPKSKGGENSFGNAEVRSRAGNLSKGDKMPELPPDSTPPTAPPGEPK